MGGREPIRHWRIRPDDRRFYLCEYAVGPDDPTDYTQVDITARITAAPFGVIGELERDIAVAVAVEVAGEASGVAAARLAPGSSPRGKSIRS